MGWAQRQRRRRSVRAPLGAGGRGEDSGSPGEGVAEGAGLGGMEIPGSEDGNCHRRCQEVIDKQGYRK